MDSRAPRSWFDEIYLRLVQYGGAGVSLFFVLSGFLITGILLDTRGSPNAWRNFLARRALRIFPLYYAVLAIYFVGLPLLGHVPPEERAQGWYWAYLSNFHIATHGWSAGKLGATWSLAVEEQFYFVWPLAVFALSRRALGWLCTALIVLSALLRGWLALRHAPEVSGLATPYELDGLAWGAWIAIFVRADRPRLSMAWAAALVASGALGICAVTGRDDLRQLLVIREGDALARASLQTLWTLSCVGVVIAGVVAVTGDRVHWALTFAPLRTLGKYSYGLYLLHVPIGVFLRDHRLVDMTLLPTLRRSHVPAVLLLTLAGCGVTFMAAWVSWYGMEKRLLALKSHFETPDSLGEAPRELGR